MDDHRALFERMDAVVVLSWSDWFTELRSNRYHYVIRFARHVPVLFVQPDLPEETYRFEATGIHNITVLHLHYTYDTTQMHLFTQAMREANILRPLFWVYNGHFRHIIASNYSLLNVYHGTEDYFSPESGILFDDEDIFLSAMHDTLNESDLVIAVSDGVKDSFETYACFQKPIHTITNGCDYKFYAPLNSQHVDIEALPIQENIVLYQGNIFNKIDFELMHALAKRLSTWQFHFCGRVVYDEPTWKELLLLPNVSYLGLLTPEELKEACYRSTVGIIPFVESEWLINRSLPLKAFEYLAAGLPVVTIPIQALLPYADVLLFASGLDAFEAALQEAAMLRVDEKHRALRLGVASQQDYDLKFDDVKNILEHEFEKTDVELNRLDVVMLYDPSSTKIATIKEYLSSFHLYSHHNIVYLPATQGLGCQTDLNKFDVVMIHYSVRVSVLHGNYTFSPAYRDAVQAFSGYKVLFLQDEYEGTNIAKHWIQLLGIHAVYTCVPEAYIEQVYPKACFPNVDFIHILTGYVPIDVASMKYGFLSKRETLIGYRGRALPYWYGSLGQEKLNIGIKVKEFCLEKGLNVDIEWEESKRIYGDGWYAFLTNCRATLGTESGAKLFDYDGSIRSTIEKKLQKNPALTYEAIVKKHIAPYETIQMNQISPKIFEAIALRTALILFEGEYSGVLIPDRHYIPLKKDFSNLEEVIRKVQDDQLIEDMTKIAYTEIIQSERYSYQTFVHEVDAYLLKHVKKRVLSTDANFLDLGNVSLTDLLSNSVISQQVMRPSYTIYTFTPYEAPMVEQEDTQPTADVQIDVVPEKVRLSYDEIKSKSKKLNVSKELENKRMHVFFLKVYALFVKGVRAVTPRFFKTLARKSMTSKFKHRLGPFIHRFL